MQSGYPRIPTEQVRDRIRSMLAEFRPTLILTAEFDTLLAEMREIASDMEEGVGR